MLTFRSTRAEPTEEGVSLREAIRRGISPDGGLYLPTALPRMPASSLEVCEGVPFPDVAAGLVSEIFGPGLVEVASGLDFPISVRRLDEGDAGPGTWIVELFHGPTLSFKDVGARVLARLLSVSRTASDPTVTILTATSGDTGGAVADAFHRVAGTEAVVLFPKEGVSPLQRAQFTTLGDNVRAIEVDGSFDDCQRLVKEAFLDPDLVRARTLTSANSINVGRLLPQALYYLYATAQLPAEEPDPLVVVPSGNLGNLTAGVMAREMGARIGRFVGAVNRNRTFVDYLETGRYEPRPSVRTPSNAMDVGAPSNLERLDALVGGVEGARRTIDAYTFDDDATLDGIRRVYDRSGALLDPHTAVGFLALEAARARGGEPRPALLMATAHPAKFSETMVRAVGHPVELPERVGDLLDRAESVERIRPDFDDFRALLLQP